MPRRGPGGKALNGVPNAGYVHLQDAELTAGQARPEEANARAGDDLRKGMGTAGFGEWLGGKKECVSLDVWAF